MLRRRPHCRCSVAPNHRRSPSEYGMQQFYNKSCWLRRVWYAFAEEREFNIMHWNLALHSFSILFFFSITTPPVRAAKVPIGRDFAKCSIRIFALSLKDSQTLSLTACICHCVYPIHHHLKDQRLNPKHEHLFVPLCETNWTILHSQQLQDRNKEMYANMNLNQFTIYVYTSYYITSYEILSFINYQFHSQVQQLHFNIQHSILES